MLRSLFVSCFVLSAAVLPDPTAAPKAGEAGGIALAQRHYDRAREELASTGVTALSPEQVEARGFLLEALRAYSQRADFGQNPDFPGARVPYFVDAGGRRCAVAELLHATGEDALVEAVRARDNHAWIVDLAEDPAFRDWLDRSGLTIEDAARIQAPPQLWLDTSQPGPTPGSGRYDGPGDTGGSARAPSGSSAPSGGSSGPAPSPSAPTPATSGPSTPPRPPGAPTPATLAMESDDGWWLWWEYNKVEFIRPNRLGLWGFPATGTAESSFLERTSAARASLEPVLVRALSDADAGIRAASALAIGRISRGTAVEHLLKALDDPSSEVRDRAILSLGATGAADAVLPLLAIARTGRVSDGFDSRISRQASALAVVALAIGRRGGFDARVDREVAELARSRNRSDRDDLAMAAMIYHRLSPCPELAAVAIELATDSSRSPGLRCRAVESLSSSRDERTLSLLQNFLSGPRLDLRRSAALALGAYDNSLALPPLMTAFELESESLTRGFLLLSIGRRDGEKARNFLIRASEDGGITMRKWSALALGIHARRNPDSGMNEIRKAIRSAALRERNRDAAPAYWLAAGLARDELSRSTLRDGLAYAKDPRARMYAATALALLDGDGSVAVLRDRLVREESPQVRVTIAGMLGALGRPEDAPALFDVLHGLREPQLQSFAASALSFHGSPEAFLALNEVARAKTGGIVRRAAAIEGLGMLLSDAPPLALADASRQANYTVFNEWVKGLFQVTL